MPNPDLRIQWQEFRADLSEQLRAQRHTLFGWFSLTERAWLFIILHWLGGACLLLAACVWHDPLYLLCALPCWVLFIFLLYLNHLTR